MSQLPLSNSKLILYRKNSISFVTLRALFSFKSSSNAMITSFTSWPLSKNSSLMYPCYLMTPSMEVGLILMKFELNEKRRRRSLSIIKEVQALWGGYTPQGLDRIFLLSCDPFALVAGFVEASKSYLLSVQRRKAKTLRLGAFEDI